MSDLKQLKWVLIAALLIAAVVFIVLQPQGKVLTIGDTVPDFRLKDLHGNDFFLNRYQGQVLLINFWATWCTYCRVELPYLDGFQRQYAVKGFQTVSVLKDTNNIDLALEINNQNDLSYPVLLDKDGSLFRIFGANALPHTVLVDRHGKIRFIHIGFNSKDTPQLEREINQLLQEK